VLLLVLDLVGITVFAVSGGLLAVRHRLDMVGVVVLGVVTGLGGGVIRDLLIGDVPPAGFADWRYLVTAMLAGLVTFWLHPTFERTIRLVNVFDAFGLGLFAVAGAAKASEYGLGPVQAALLGMVTGVGGGMIRDVLVGRVPVVLSPSELYALPAVIGATVVAVGLHLGVPALPLAIAGAALTITLRLLAIWRGWQGPIPRLR
jgi:uncharacterized membrane protein YeiH